VNPSRAPRPDWLKVRAPSGMRVEEVSGTLARHGLRTVCREARCPNVGECWGAGTATVILLGDVCTRGCAFCFVSAGAPAPPDPSEPDRVARAAAELSWRHVVVTSVTRDDLPDGGAAHFAGMGARQNNPGVRVEKVRIEILVNLTLSLVGLLGRGSKGKVGGKFAKLEGPGQMEGIGICVDLYRSGPPIAPEAR